MCFLSFKEFKAGNNIQTNSCYMGDVISRCSFLPCFFTVENTLSCNMNFRQVSPIQHRAHILSIYIYSLSIANIRTCIREHIPSVTHQSRVSLKSADDIFHYPHSLLLETVLEEYKFRFIFSSVSEFRVWFHTSCSPLPTDAIPDVWLRHRLEPPITMLKLKPIGYNLTLGFVTHF